MFIHIIQKTSLYRFCDILPLKNSHLKVSKGFCMFIHIIQKTSLYRFCDILPLKNSHLKLSKGFCMFIHIIQKTSLYRFCDILPLKNSHLCSTPEWLVPDRNDSLVTTCPRISCFQAQSSNNRVLRQYGLVYVICEIWILGKSYVYVYVPFILLNLGETPLHIALRQDHYECALLLIARGARLDLPNQQAQVECLLESVLLIRSDQYNLGPPRSGSVTTKNLQKS
jgi:hypothetical protein